MRKIAVSLLLSLSALPWQKNNFNAGFEMKSSNGSFGIKVEVHGGRGY